MIRKFTLSLVVIFFASIASFGQHSVTITVLDNLTGNPIEGADVMLDVQSAASDASGVVIFSNVSPGVYDYFVSKSCFASFSASVTVDESDVSLNAELMASNTNNVFFFIGAVLAELDVTVTLTDNAEYYQSFVTTDTFGGEMIGDVPFGTYTYTFSKPCYNTISGTIIIDCNAGDGIAIFENLTSASTNNVFFFIGDFLAILDVTVNLTDGAEFDATFVTSDTFGGEMIGDVPYGTYTYTLTKSCHQMATGTVTVHCNGGDGIAVFDAPAEISIDPSFTLSENVLTASAADMNYQWIDCNDNNAPIPDATSQSFTFTQNGNYAVIVSGENCSATSSCLNVIFIGISDAAASIYGIYPNPVHNNMVVDYKGSFHNAILQIIGSDGRLIRIENFYGNQRLNLNLEQLQPGFYSIQITIDEHSLTRNFIKD